MRANLPDVRDRSVVEEWDAKDPLPRLERRLREDGLVTDAELASLHDEVEAEVETAIDLALADEPRESRTTCSRRSTRPIAGRILLQPPANESSASSRPSARPSPRSSRPTKT